MSDRLAELRRQRALVQTHLSWLDREIAAAAANADSPADSSPRRETAPATVAPSSAALVAGPVPPSTSAADSILERYRTEPGTLQRDVRQGCFLYFAAACVLLGLGVLAMYFLISAR